MRGECAGSRVEGGSRGVSNRAIPAPTETRPAKKIRRGVCHKPRTRPPQSLFSACACAIRRFFALASLPNVVTRPHSPSRSSRRNLHLRTSTHLPHPRFPASSLTIHFINLITYSLPNTSPWRVSLLSSLLCGKGRYHGPCQQSRCEVQNRANVPRRRGCRPRH